MLYRPGAVKKTGKTCTAKDKLQIENAKREIESVLLEKVRAEINAEYQIPDDDGFEFGFDYDVWFNYLEQNKLATPLLKYRTPVPTPRQKYNSVVVDIDEYIAELQE